MIVTCPPFKSRINRTKLKAFNVLLQIECFKTIFTNIPLSVLGICLHRPLKKKKKCLLCTQPWFWRSTDGLCNEREMRVIHLKGSVLSWTVDAHFPPLTSHVNGETSELLLIITHTLTHTETHDHTPLTTAPTTSCILLKPDRSCQEVAH